MICVAGGSVDGYSGQGQVLKLFEETGLYYKNKCIFMQHGAGAESVLGD